MKKLLAGFAVVGTFFLASAQSISFDQTVLDYGKVKPGSDGNRKFIVKNTGDKPLIISNVRPSCGCTTPDWTKDPIMPGKTGEIKVHYNTNIVGPVTTKLIEVFSNDPENQRSVVHIKVHVDQNAPEPKPLTAAEKKKIEIDAKAEEISKVQTQIQAAAESKDKTQLKALKKNLKTLNKDLKALNTELKTLG